VAPAERACLGDPQAGEHEHGDQRPTSGRSRGLALVTIGGRVEEGGDVRRGVALPRLIFSASFACCSSVGLGRGFVNSKAVISAGSLPLSRSAAAAALAALARIDDGPLGWVDCGLRWALLAADHLYANVLSGIPRARPSPEGFPPSAS
jgi:hypothetical protein